MTASALHASVKAPARCNHTTVVSGDQGKTHHCVSCGEEMVVAATMRSAWGSIGVILQRRRLPKPESPSRQTVLL